MEIWLLWLVWVSCEWQDVFYTENSISILVFTHHKSLILYFHIFTIFIYFTLKTQVMKSSLTAKTRVPCTVDVWITSELTVNASRILFSPAQPSWIDQGAFMRSRGLSRFVTLIFLNPRPRLSPRLRFSSPCIARRLWDLRLFHLPIPWYWWTNRVQFSPEAWMRKCR